MHGPAASIAATHWGNKMKIERCHWEPPDGSAALPAISLDHPKGRLVVVPTRGAKIVSLFHQTTQKEWLWFNPRLSWTRPSPQDDYVKLHDVGGWDECFPTVAPTTVGGRQWPDHGDLWWREWEADIRGERLWTGVSGEGYLFERTIEGTPSGFRLAYQVTNQGDEPLPYLWCAHPLLCTDPLLNVEIFGRPRALVPESGGGTGAASYRWPQIEGRMFDVIGKPSTLAIKLFLEMKRGQVAITDGNGATLQMRWPLNQLPLLGLWINEGGWSGIEGPPYSNVGVEPATGAPDDLAIALNAWNSARVLQPGKRDGWWLEVNLGHNVEK